MNQCIVIFGPGKNFKGAFNAATGGHLKILVNQTGTINQSLELCVFRQLGTVGDGVEVVDDR